MEENNKVTNETEMTNGKRPCYFWKQWKYYVDIEQISLKGWIEWCNDIYMIQHRKARPRGQKIYIDPRLERAVIKARLWNKDKTEQWLKDHGYKYTMTVETRYQFPFQDENEVVLIDADANACVREA